MCYHLSTDRILLNYFANSKKQTITLGSLNDLAGEIIKKCYNGITVKTDRDTIGKVVSSMPDVFSMRDHTIYLVNRNSFAIKNIKLFNENMPGPVRERCIKACKDYGNQK